MIEVQQQITRTNKAVNSSDDIREKKAAEIYRIEIRLVPLSTGQDDFSVYIDKCSSCLDIYLYMYINGDGSA